MEEIFFKIKSDFALALAISQGWSPLVEDFSGTLEGDEYPKIENPVSYQDFLSELIPRYIENILLSQARKTLDDNLKSQFNTVRDKVSSGQFDQLLLSGEIQQILRAIAQELIESN